MTEEASRRAMAAHFTDAAQREREAAERVRQHREARRAAILGRYGSEAAALAPCARERALRDGTWGLVVPGDPESGPSLMGWRGGSASSLPLEVLRDVSTAIRAPATAAEAWEERGHWAHRAEVREVLGGPPSPPWVLARCVFLEARLDTLFALLPGAEAAQAEWRRCEAEFEREQAARAAPAHAPEVSADGGPEQETPDSPIVPPPSAEEGVQSGQAARTRAEARAAVRALLGEDLTDREIARRVGVSPTTVAAVRKALPEGGPLP